MARLALEYLLLVFVASLGVIQLAAARGGLRGLLFFPRRWQAALFGLLALAASFWWFFAAGNRNQPGLEGGQQTFSLPLAAFWALLSSFLVASWLRRIFSRPPRGQGLGALQQGTFLQLLLGPKDRR